ncbi:DUF1232 domain-containing protein [Desulfotalea psychrophila]|uniref:Hypothetical membrane protein n=1 Tax=Desulfotalea psychrophila (strain LSv54 / DSM 12343) TaxID=177439 RepID=Q6AIT7_DESPS|nr:DUF1232 domain-containing protein [Desulfotalea psychrophila]CAG37743.1 hypothetical membrane protein [Desulfotalea psychrophila LSv54]
MVRLLAVFFQVWRRSPSILMRLFKRGTPWRARLLILAALLYLFIPYDFIPEWLVGIGLVDDLFIVTGLLALAESIAGGEQ